MSPRKSIPRKIGEWWLTARLAVRHYSVISRKERQRQSIMALMDGKSPPTISWREGVVGLVGLFLTSHAIWKRGPPPDDDECARLYKMLEDCEKKRVGNFIWCGHYKSFVKFNCKPVDELCTVRVNVQ